MNSPTQNHLWKLLLILLFCSFSAYSQKFDLTEKIPVDPNVKIGTLENGLTYYIRKNAKPENRAELRLFVNIGAVNEDDDQLGLAHFVEHMCFNGTKHFKENELIHYLQSIGMKMGPDINGFTSFDETVYMITVPTDDMEVFDKGLLIMEDWAHNVSFDHDEIDKERGIVIEEWRLGRGAGDLGNRFFLFGVIEGIDLDLPQEGDDVREARVIEGLVAAAADADEDFGQILGAEPAEERRRLFRPAAIVCANRFSGAPGRSVDEIPTVRLCPPPTST